MSNKLLNPQVAAVRKYLETNTGSLESAGSSTAGSFLTMESADKVDSIALGNLGTSLNVGDLTNAVRAVETPLLTMLGFENETAEQQAVIQQQMFTLNAQQQNVAALLMLAYADPVAYAKAAKSLNVNQAAPSDAEEFTFLSADAFGSESEELVQLSYDQRELRDMMPHSIIFNVKASRLSKMGDELYTTLTLAPNQIGYDVSFRRPLVFNHLRRNTDGSMADWTKRPLLDAFTYNEVLANETTDLNPIYRSDDSNAKYFVDAAIVEPYDFTWKGTEYKTSWLKPGELIDMIGVAEDNTILANGYSDNTDALDAQITLTDVLLEIISAKTGEKSYVPFKTAGLIYNGFQKSLEGDFRKMSLAFDTHSIYVDELTKDVNNKVPAALQDIIDTKSALQISIEVTGSTNVEKGGLKVHPATGSVHRLVDADNVEQLRKGAVFQAISEDLTINLVGYHLKIRRNNANRRERGKHFDFNTKQERYAIGLLAPYSIPRPMDWTENAADLDVLIQGCNARFDNLMVEKLLSYRDTLASIASSRFRQFGDLQIEGYGRYLIRPWFESVTLDLEGRVQGTTTAARRQEVSDSIMNVVREMAYRMYAESGYQPALSLLSSNSDEKPRCVVATDNYIPQFLSIDGDFRSVGITFNFVVVDTTNILLRDTLFVTLSRGIKGSPDPLTFGMFLYVPELISTAQVPRNGGFGIETMIQPRARFVNNCPLLGEIKLLNLRKVYTENINLPVDIKSTPAP